MPETNAAPSITVGMPVWNSSDTVRRAVSSLRAQTYRNFQILVSDNHSDDGTTEILAEISRADARVRHVTHPGNIGMLPNFEFVVREAKSDLFIWAAADDHWHPNFLSELVRLLNEHPDAGVAMSSVQTVNRRGEEIETIRFTRWASLIGKPRWWAAAQMMNILPGPPTHYYIYGLWRKPVLDRLMGRGFPRGRAGDRVLMCEATFGTYLVDSPQVLYNRTVQETSLAERYSRDPLGEAWRDPAAERRYLLTLGRRLLTSPVIPLHRRLAAALPMWIVLAVRRRRVLLGRARAS